MDSCNQVKDRPLEIMIASVLILSCFFAAMFIAPSQPDNIPPTLNSPARIEYSVHAPISIGSNSGFTNATGVVWGSGTALDPFIIEGWDINATGGSSAIYIINTNAFFRIEDCRLQSIGEVVVIYSSNGLIFNCTCSNGSIGINLAGQHNSIVNCNCSYNALYGILITGYRNNIVNNTCLMNRGDSGIYVESNSNTLVNNTCSGNGSGFYLFGSNYNTLIDNTCTRNAVNGIHLTVSYYNQLNRNNCSDNYHNLTNGDEAGIYLDTSRGNVLTNNTCMNNVFSGISVRTNSNSNVLINNTCTNNSYGAYMDDSAYNNLVSNNFSGNLNYGIWLHYTRVTPCRNNTLTKNIYCNNGGYGAYITAASDNRFWNNLFVHNRGAGDTYNSSHIQAYDAGTNNLWNDANRYGNYWSDWRTPDNVAPFGIVDIPYNISGSAGAKDFSPLVERNADLYPPTTIVSLSGTFGTNGWYKSPITLSLNATDPESGVNATFYRIGTSGSWLNYSSSFVLSSEGSSTVQFYSRDNASNNETVESVIVKIDKTSPFGTIVVQGGATFANAYLGTLSLTAGDNLSGVEQFRCSNDGMTWGSWESWQNLSDSMSWNLQIGDGLKTIFFQIMDNASNIATYNDTIMLDTIPPTLTFWVASGVKFTGSSATINWSATDVNGIASYEYSLDGSAFVSCGLMTHIDLTNLTAGSHKLTIRAIDVAGNGIDQTIRFNTETAAGISGDLVLYGGIAAVIILVIIATLVIMRKKKGS